MSEHNPKPRYMLVASSKTELQQLWDMIAGVQWRAQKAECEAANHRVEIGELKHELAEAHRYIEGLERELKKALATGGDR